LLAIIQEHDLLKHPFYEAWTAGKLSLEDLRFYAGQYYRQVEAFPRFVSQVHSLCPEISARKILLENLIDEELHGTDHPALWMQFAEGLGMSEAQIRTAAPLPETNATVETLYGLTAGKWTSGLCALFAYEAQVPEVSRSKIAGLRRHYGVGDDRTLEFFSAHLKYDVAHSRAVGELIDRHADAESAVRATRQASEALWAFLDGVAKETHVTC
jgi:pyrroloquinoline-quinone synthase